MIKPSQFCANQETAGTNAFQKGQQDGQNESVTIAAVTEWQAVVQALRGRGLEVTTFETNPARVTPDAVFPNNWISFHSQKIYLYPMFAENRRRERNKDIVKFWTEQASYEVVDLAQANESIGQFLEGTGSMVLDRVNKIAYACVSPRTSEQVLEQWCAIAEYTPFAFQAKDRCGRAIYHTNVMMSIGKDFAIVCMDSVVDKKEVLRESLQKTGRNVIDISLGQMEAFAGNVLALSTSSGEQLIVLSTTAFKALDDVQRDVLSTRGTLVQVDIPTIERYGGGGVRCMLAEVF